MFKSPIGPYHEEDDSILWFLIVFLLLFWNNNKRRKYYCHSTVATSEPEVNEPKITDYEQEVEEE